MKERIIEFLRRENKSSSQFAEEIGVQPSSISHIVSGRNNPSLDFVNKMLLKYPSLSPDWLLMGKGDMFRDGKDKIDFDSLDTIASGGDKINTGLFSDGQAIRNIESPGNKTPFISNSEGKPAPAIKRALKIAIFYSDNSFEEYLPS